MTASFCVVCLEVTVCDVVYPKEALTAALGDAVVEHLLQLLTAVVDSSDNEISVGRSVF
jgi:hypothetical protein